MCFFLDFFTKKPPPLTTVWFLDAPFVNVVRMTQTEPGFFSLFCSQVEDDEEESETSKNRGEKEKDEDKDFGG